MRGSADDARRAMRRCEDRLRVISEITRGFAEATTDYARLLDNVARSLSEVIHDSCAVFLLSEDGTQLDATALHAIDPSGLEEIRRRFEAPLRLTEQHMVRAVLETGEALLVPEANWHLPRMDTTAEQAEWRRRLGLHSLLLVALRVRGRSIGVLCLGRFRPESSAFDASDQELAQNLADHASLAIENASLYAAARRARLEAERAEEVVRRSEASHRLFFESVPIAILVVDAVSLRILAANSAALRLYGYSLEEFLELELDALRHPDDNERLRAELNARGDADSNASGRHLRKDGSVLYISGGSHLATFEGRPARFAFVVDHTERVRAERARDESHRRLYSSLDQVSEGYSILSHDLRYLYVNEAGARHAHLSKSELIGHSPMELYPGFEGSKIHQALTRAAQQRTRERVEEELIHADGEKGYFELTIQPVPEGIVVLSVDATERRRAEIRRDLLEGQLRQAQKMEAVGKLAGGIAHDFNNLLSVILGYSADILTRTEAWDPMRSDLEEIHKAGKRAAELTRQLLLFSRQQVFDPKVLDLNEIVRGMERMLQRVLGEQLELSITLAPDLGRLKADRSNVEQVIMNLAVNARDAMPSGGRLTIETANVVLDEDFVQKHLGTDAGPYVLLVISDTGIGIDQATLSRIFEPFFSTKEQGKGTGLGLSTVFGIVKQCGGGIWVHSEPGRGTTFKVYLPRVEALPETRPASLAPRSSRGGETVLLVEDEEQVRAVARRILERHGYRVIVARNPDDAIRICTRDQEPIHLLMTDVVMPHINGIELARRVLSRRPAMKVLYVSGYSDRSFSRDGVLERGAAFLQKPFTADLLACKVRSVLDGE